MTRPPRYRFPETVRSATRDMAARMVRDGAVARTPEQMEQWIAGAPDVRESLQKGGYGTAFGASDLFPLLQVFTGQPTEGAAAPAPPPRRRWMGAVVGLVLALLLVALVMAMLP